MAKIKMDYQKGFILYKDSRALVKKLSLEDAGRLFNAIFDYEAEGITPDDLTPAADMAFTAIQNYLDRDAAAYNEKCKKNAENGRKGGLATQKKARKNKIKANQANALNSKANQANKDIEPEKKIENMTESDLGGVKGAEPKGTETAPAPAAGGSVQAINWDSFTKAASRVYMDDDTETKYTLPNCLAIFKYFFDSYSKNTGEKHPVLSKDAIKGIIEKMPYITDQDGEIIELEPDDYKALIDQYFQTEFDNCDYHITHFFNGDIRLFRYYETEY